MLSTALLVNGKNEMVTLLLLRMGIFPAKAQRRQVRNLFLLPWRLGAFAGYSGFQLTLCQAMPCSEFRTGQNLSAVVVAGGRKKKLEQRP
jgi:hypothetical protein